MLSLTRKADYAFVAMAELAQRSPDRVSAREIAETIRVSLPMLSNVLHQLHQYGLVSATKGSKGGYRLAKVPEDISLADMIDAMQGPFRLVACCASERGADGPECDIEDSCRIKGPVRRVHERLRSFLSDIDLDHIAFERVPVALGIDVGVKTSLVECGEMIADEQSSVAAGDP